MGRIRTIKPEFTHNEALSALPAETHLCAAGLLTYADDEGYFNANPGLVKAAVFPIRETSLSIHDMLAQLAATGFVRLGTATNGKRYGQIVKFTEHQRVNRPTASKIKMLNITWEQSLPIHAELTADSLPEGNGKERNTDVSELFTENSTNDPEQTFQLESNEKESDDLESAIETLFSFFVAKTKKDPARYRLTPKRKAKGHARLKQCLKEAKDGELAAAVEIMTVAIERLAMSPFHNGQNKDSRSYTDWETHLLRRDWDEFYAMWLDDSRYGGAGGSNSQPAGGVA